MQLLVLRHGQAKAMQYDDASRELTDRGRAQVAWIIRARAAQLARVRIIWASPFVRAQQTAAIVATALKLPVITKNRLTGDTAPEQLFDTLGQTRSEQFPLLLVSHQPLVGGLVNGLCGSGRVHPMGTASLACMEAEIWAKGCAELNWLQHAEK